MADFVPLTYLNTKRYARLGFGNVRNFQNNNTRECNRFALLAWANYYILYY